MIIVYSSISCALACVGNKARETLRCRPIVPAQREVVLSDNEDASPNKVNSFRPRYAKLPTANLPDMVKPVIDMEEIDICTYQVGRGDWRERASKEQSWYLGDPFRLIASEVDSMKGQRGSHNPLSLRQRESERLVVVMTQGNACRANELCRYYVNRSERSSA